MRRIGVVLLAALMVAATVPAQWPMESLNPARDAITDEEGPPDDCPSRANGCVLWTRRPGPETIVASPVVGREQVYVGTSTGRVVAYDATSGAFRWEHQVQTGAGGNVEIAGAPVYVPEDGVAGSVVFGSRKGIVRSLDAANGFVEWTLDVGQPVTTPLLFVEAEDKIYFGDHEGRVRGINATTGDTVWRVDVTQADGSLEAGFAADDTYLYVPMRGFELLRMALDDGGDRLNNRNFDESLRAAPTVHNGTIYVAAEQAGVYALDDQLNVQWQQRNLGDKVLSTPLVHNGTVFVTTDGGEIFKLDASDGAILDNEPILRTFQVNDDLRDQPVLADGTLYVPSEEGQVIAVTPDDLSVRWRLDISGDDVSEHRLTHLAIWDRKLYVVQEGSESDDGGVLWVLGPPGAAGNTVPVAKARIRARAMTVELDARASSDLEDPDRNLTFTWELDDGTTYEGRHLLYTYRDPGRYTVLLEVRDTDGAADRIAETVEVRPQPTTPWTQDRGTLARHAHVDDVTPGTWDPHWGQNTSHETVAPPLLTPEALYTVSEDGTVEALDHAGNRTWARDVGRLVSAPSLGRHLVVAAEERVVALHPDNGTVAWEHQDPDRERFMAATATERRVFASAEDRRLVALNASADADPRVLWTGALHSQARHGSVVDPANGTVYALTTTGRVHAFDAADGTERWVANPDMEARHLALRSGSLYATGFRADGLAGEVQRLSVDDGSRLWRHELDRTPGPPAVGDRIYVHAGGDAVALSTFDGSEVWRTTLDATVRGGPVAGDGRVFYPTADGVQPLHARNGTPAFDGPLRGGADGLALHDGMLAATGGDAVHLVGRRTLPASFEVEASEPLRVNDTLAFQDSSELPTTLNRTWDADDGTILQGFRVTHNYSEPGNYTVTLSVGEDPVHVTRRTVEVLPALEPPDDGDDGDGDGNVTPPPDDDGDGPSGPPVYEVPAPSTVAVTAAVAAAAWVLARKD